MKQPTIPRLTTPRMDRCIGCHGCSMACARLVHGLHSWTAAGIRIRSSGGLTTGFEADLCVACEPAPCALACPTEALTQRRGGGVRVKQALCISCGECARACPVNAIHYAPETGKPYLCIHCGRCVAFCPQNCLELAGAGRGSGREESKPAGAGQGAEDAEGLEPAVAERGSEGSGIQAVGSEGGGAPESPGAGRGSEGGEAAQGGGR